MIKRLLFYLMICSNFYSLSFAQTYTEMEKEVLGRVFSFSYDNSVEKITKNYGFQCDNIGTCLFILEVEDIDLDSVEIKTIEQRLCQIGKRFHADSVYVFFTVGKNNCCNKLTSVMSRISKRNVIFINVNSDNFYGRQRLISSVKVFNSQSLCLLSKDGARVSKIKRELKKWNLLGDTSK